MRQWLTTFLDNRTKAASNLVSNYRISNVTTNGVGHCSRMVASYEGQPKRSAFTPIIRAFEGRKLPTETNPLRHARTKP